MGLAPGRWYKNGNGFSSGHVLLGPRYPMIDVDRMKIYMELSVSKENSLFFEYQRDYVTRKIEFIAVFSMKHRQAKLNAISNKKIFDFVNEESNVVTMELARRVGARLFIVLHGTNEEPPFEIYEVDLQSGGSVQRAFINGNTKEAWEKCWSDLGLRRK